MGCQTKVCLDDNLTFGICTHDPDTGVLTDTDSAPIFRVYENESATPISGGKMYKLDDSNTTGFYSAQIACTTRNGFEIGNTYTIYIEATVDSDTGGMCYAFRVKKRLVTDGLRYVTDGLLGTKKCNISATAAPTVNDDTDSGYEILSMWIDITNDRHYICLDASAGAAVWLELGLGGTAHVL